MVKAEKRFWYAETPFLRLLQADFSPADARVRQNAARLHAFGASNTAAVFDGQAAFRAGGLSRFTEEALRSGAENVMVPEKAMQIPEIDSVASGVLQAFADQLTGVFSASRGEETLAYTEQALAEAATGKAGKSVAAAIKSTEAALPLPRWERWNRHGDMPISGFIQRIVQRGDAAAVQLLGSETAFAPAAFTAKGLPPEGLPAPSVFSKGQQLIAWENRKQGTSPMQKLDFVMRREAALRPFVVPSNLHEKPGGDWRNNLGGQEQASSSDAINSVLYSPAMTYAARAENRYQNIQPREAPAAVHTWEESGVEAGYPPAMELRHMQESVVQEEKVRLAAPEIKVDMSGMQNSISSEMDIDHFLGVLTDKLERALSISAAGVHVG